MTSPQNKLYFSVPLRVALFAVSFCKGKKDAAATAHAASCMQKTIVYILLAFAQALPMIAFAQINPSLQRFQLLDTNSSKISLFNQIYFNSTIFDNQFIYNGFKQGHFTKEARLKLFDNAPALSLNGFDGISSISWSTRLKNIQFFISLNERMHAHASLDNTLLQLTLLGNKPFEGQTANAQYQSNVQWLHYQQVQAGMTWFLPEYSTYISGSVSLLNGSNAYDLSIYEASLYTDSLGRYVDLEAHASEKKSNPASTTFFTQNGLGASIDAMINIPIPLFSNLDSSDARFIFEVNDLGFIGWKSSSQEQIIDTSLMGYKGVFINPYLTDSTHKDSLVLTKPAQKGSFTTFLPAFLSFSLQKNIKNHLFTLGYTQRTNQNMSPYAYVQDMHQISSVFSLLYGLNYGGYGSLGGALGFQYKSKKFLLDLRLNQLEGQIFQSYSAGNAVMLNLTKIF